MLLAFVVSVVADAANPDTAPEEIATELALTEVILPYPSTVIEGIEEALP